MTEHIALADLNGVELPRASVLIPCRNGANWIGMCLECIDKNDYPKDRLEVLVIDGMSEDNTRAIVEEFIRLRPYIRLIENPKKITPAALNLGIAMSSGQVVLRMDVHVEYPPNYISSLVRWLLVSKADNVGGVCLTSPSKNTVMAHAIAIGMSHPVGVGNSYFRIGVNRPCWVDTVPFGCFRRELFDKIGLFDEDLVRDQDDEFNSRIILSGGRILLVPDVVCQYYARDSLGKLWRMLYQYGYYKPLAARKLKRVFTFRQLMPPLLVFALVSAVVLCPWAWLAGILLCLIGSAYATFLGMGVMQVAFYHGPLVAVAVLPAFLTLHFGYGLGYLHGIFDFWILRRKSKKTNSPSLETST